MDSFHTMNGYHTSNGDHYKRLVTIIEMGTILGIVVILRFLPLYGMVTFLKDCNDFKGQGRLMIFYHPRDGDLLKDSECPRDSDHHKYDGQ